MITIAHDVVAVFIASCPHCFFFMQMNCWDIYFGAAASKTML